MASICCSPPESVPACCLVRSPMRGKRVTTSSMDSDMLRASLWFHAPTSRFSFTVRSGKMARPSGTREMPASMTSAVPSSARLCPS